MRISSGMLKLTILGLLSILSFPNILTINAQNQVNSTTIKYLHKVPSNTTISNDYILSSTLTSAKSLNKEIPESFLKLFYIKLGLIFCYSIVFFAILLGNILLIGALSSQNEALNPTNIFILNLAFADLCVAIFCVYQNLSLYLLSEWIFSDVLCRMYHFVHVVSYTASVYIHVAIALERYLALVKPFWARIVLTKARLRLIIICVWIFSAFVCLPRFLIYKTMSARFFLCKYSKLSYN